MDVVTSNYWAGPIFSLFYQNYMKQRKVKNPCNWSKELKVSAFNNNQTRPAQSTVLCFTTINHLHGHLRKQMFTSRGSRGHLHVCKTQCDWQILINWLFDCHCSNSKVANSVLICLQPKLRILQNLEGSFCFLIYIILLNKINIIILFF